MSEICLGRRCVWVPGTSPGMTSKREGSAACRSERPDRGDLLTFEPESNLLADGQLLQQGCLADDEGLGSRGPAQRFHRLVGDGDPTGVRVDHLYDPDDFRLGEWLGGLSGRGRTACWRAALAAAPTAAAAPAASALLGLHGGRGHHEDRQQGYEAFE